MRRRTKIVATLGPATDNIDVLRDVIIAGANVFRLNFSHGVAADHIKRAENVRRLSKELGLYTAILGDLQGPKIRVSTFAEKKVQLKLGQSFALDATLGLEQGNVTEVGIDYKELPTDVVEGDILLLDDGRVQLKVLSTNGTRVETTVIVEGPLSNNKGINRLGGGLTAPALTEKDLEDIKTAALIKTDFLAVSFPRSGDDMRTARKLAKEAGLDTRFVSKIERAEAVADDETLDDIIRASDVVMVARGDLGVEIGDAALVAQQKRIIARSRQLNKVVITATQMMESMIESPMPTRAEVMDVANAVLDGTDAVMLSAETAAGKYPVQAVESMARICIGAEEHPSVQTSNHRLDIEFTEIAETVGLAAMYAANNLKGVKAIVALTESGYSAKLMSRITSGLPIFSLSQHQRTLDKVSLYRGVYPVFFDSSKHNMNSLITGVIVTLKAKDMVQSGDLIIMTHGDVMETVG
ncbi:MAG: pyruvate kinase, partial [Algicola sp.]|nr:pyruvate kinase [Algicola sp.]